MSESFVFPFFSFLDLMLSCFTHSLPFFCCCCRCTRCRQWRVDHCMSACVNSDCYLLTRSHDEFNKSVLSWQGRLTTFSPFTLLLFRVLFIQAKLIQTLLGLTVWVRWCFIKNGFCSCASKNLAIESCSLRVFRVRFSWTFQVALCLFFALGKLQAFVEMSTIVLIT